MSFKSVLIWMIFFYLFVSGCKKWDDHTAVNNPALGVNILEEIGQRSNLSKFYEYLQKTGLDKELSSSKSYTVWAPVNDALQTLSPLITGDSAKLRQFIANHIANLSYFTRDVQSVKRIPMLNGKWVSFLNNKFDEATVTEADKYVGNGVLHIIDKAAPVLPNAWELVNETKSTFQQNSFILSQNFNGFDPSLAVIDSISSVTGLPVYRPGTGIVVRNSFIEGVFDLKVEEKLYTYFILNDAAFDVEVNKLKPYHATGTADSTTRLASYAAIKDLAVEGLYTIAQLPDTLVSKFDVKIPIDKSKILETRRLSNGVAYVMSGVNFNVKHKIQTIIVQAEGPRAYYRLTGEPVTPTQNNTSAVFTRIRVNPLSGLTFTDIFAYNHGIASLNIQYQVRSLPSVKYKVYWTAVNDTIRVNGVVNPVSFNQRLAMGSRTATNFPYIAVAPLNFGEMYLGDYTQTSFGTLDMFLIAAASATAGANSLTLDYIKLVPDIP